MCVSTLQGRREHQMESNLWKIPPHFSFRPSFPGKILLAILHTFWYIGAWGPGSCPNICHSDQVSLKNFLCKFLTLFDILSIEYSQQICMVLQQNLKCNYIDSLMRFGRLCNVMLKICNVHISFVGFVLRRNIHTWTITKNIILLLYYITDKLCSLRDKQPLHRLL
jgi:hypothetical protein